MRSWMVVAVMAVGCSGGNRYSQTPFDTSNDTDVETDTDTDADSDADTDSDTDTDTDSDTDADTDSDTDADADIACHPYDPIEVFGFNRTYDVIYEGQTGVETQSGQGLDVDSNGQPVYSVQSTMTAGAEGWSGSMYMNCDTGSTDGAYYNQSVMNYKYSGTDVPITATNNPPRRYLPGMDTLGSEGSWSYSYSLDMDASGLPVSFPTSGTYVELGTESITVPAGTFDAYYLTNEFTQDRSALSSFGMEGGVVEAFSETYYVEGLGLVYELTVDKGDGHTIMEKKLKSYSGLTPK